MKIKKAPTISLVGMFKNEAGNLRAVLEAAKPYVHAWTFLDTGSTDGTQEIIREVMGDLPGTLYEEDFRGYAATRNRVLELDACDERADFQLMISADEYLKGGEHLAAHLLKYGKKAEIHALKVFDGDAASPQFRITRTGSGWVYDDLDCGIHEVPTHPDDADQKRPRAYCPPAFIVHVCSDPQRRAESVAHVHIPALEAALTRNPENPRALEYMAHSIEYLMQFAPAEAMAEMAQQAAVFYYRRSVLPFVNDAERLMFDVKRVNVMRYTDLLAPAQLRDMAREICTAAPKNPAAALLLATIESTCSDSTDVSVYTSALQAAGLAEEARLSYDKMTDGTLPLFSDVEWKAHRLCAIALSGRAKLEPARAQELYGVATRHVQAALIMGGDPEILKMIPLSDAEDTITPLGELQ